MHYTSIENIHRVTAPLFLDGLRKELSEIKEITVERTCKTRLEGFQKKSAKLTILDPACGSGNFLTETYLSLRRLENEVLSLLHKGQIIMDLGNPIQVSIIKRIPVRFEVPHRDFSILQTVLPQESPVCQQS